MDGLVERLGRVRHFSTLPVSALAAIVASGQVLRFSAGSVIFMEGEPCAGMYVLLAGRVNLCTMGPSGQQQILHIIEPVIMFNEVAVLDGGANPAMAVAVEDCVTWRLSCASFHALLKQYPQVGLGLLPVLAQRNRMLISRYEDMSYRSVLARTAKLLLDLSSGGTRAIVRQDHSVDTMAARIGTVREPISRALRSLREAGVIKCSRTAIVVLDAQGLARQAQMQILQQ